MALSTLPKLAIAVVLFCSAVSCLPAPEAHRVKRDSNNAEGEFQRRLVVDNDKKAMRTMIEDSYVLGGLDGNQQVSMHTGATSPMVLAVRAGREDNQGGNSKEMMMAPKEQMQEEVLEVPVGPAPVTNKVVAIPLGRMLSGGGSQEDNPLARLISSLQGNADDDMGLDYGVKEGRAFDDYGLDDDKQDQQQASPLEQLLTRLGRMNEETDDDTNMDEQTDGDMNEEENTGTDGSGRSLSLDSFSMDIDTIGRALGWGLGSSAEENQDQAPQPDQTPDAMRVLRMLLGGAEDDAQQDETPAPDNTMRTLRLLLGAGSGEAEEELPIPEQTNTMRVLQMLLGAGEAEEELPVPEEPTGQNTMRVLRMLLGVGSSEAEEELPTPEPEQTNTMRVLRMLLGAGEAEEELPIPEETTGQNTMRVLRMLLGAGSAEAEEELPLPEDTPRQDAMRALRVMLLGGSSNKKQHSDHSMHGGSSEEYSGSHEQQSSSGYYGKKNYGYSNKKHMSRLSPMSVLRLGRNRNMDGSAEEESTSSFREGRKLGGNRQGRSMKATGEKSSIVEKAMQLLSARQGRNLPVEGKSTSKTVLARQGKALKTNKAAAPKTITTKQNREGRSLDSSSKVAKTTGKTVFRRREARSMKPKEKFVVAAAGKDKQGKLEVKKIRV